MNLLFMKDAACRSNYFFQKHSVYIFLCFIISGNDCVIFLTKELQFRIRQDS